MDIEQFKNELIEYFEKNIIPENNSPIDHINHEFTITNRGHGIAFSLKNIDYGPIFYAEEMIQALDTKTIPDIAKILNEQIKTIISTNSIMHNDLHADPDNHVIFTVMPIKNLPEKYDLEKIEYEKYDNIGIIIFIKTLLKNSPVPNAYVHIRKLNDNDDKFSIYNMAIENTMCNANIRIIAHGADDSTIPPILTFTDLYRFADYFYLISNPLMKSFTHDQHFRKLYIFPSSAYEAAAIAIPETMNPDEEARFKNNVIDDMIKRYYETEQPVSCVVYDNKTETYTALIKN